MSTIAAGSASGEAGKLARIECGRRSAGALITRLAWMPAWMLIVAIAYKLQIVYVKFVGTHKQYDTVDAETIESA
ncbi:MAG: type II toxin-antitoxin system HigB family toxin [Lysobacterales bacterium]